MTTSAMLLSMTLAMTAAAPPDSPVAVDVQARDAEGRTDATLERQLEGKLREALSKQGMKVDEAATARRVIVDVRKVDVIHYEVEVRVEVDGVAREPGVPGFTCKSCRVVELYDRVLERVPEIVEAVTIELEAEPAEGEPEAGVSPGPADDGTPSDSPTEAPIRRSYRKIGVAGYVGIASAGVGLLFAAGGIPPLVESPTRRFRPGDDLVRERVDRVPLGAALVGVAGGLVVTGVVLVIVDQTVLRERRRQRSASVVLVPSVVPGGGAALRLSARF
jgi:hypothetical protein